MLDNQKLNQQLKKLEKTEINELLATTIGDFQSLPAEDWLPENIQNLLNNLLEKTRTKPGILFQLIRISATWAPFSPALNQTLRAIGSEESLKRLKNSLQIIENEL